MAQLWLLMNHLTILLSLSSIHLWHFIFYCFAHAQWFATNTSGNKKRICPKSKQLLNENSWKGGLASPACLYPGVPLCMQLLCEFQVYLEHFSTFYIIAHGTPLLTQSNYILYAVKLCCFLIAGITQSLDLGYNNQVLVASTLCCLYEVLYSSILLGGVCYHVVLSPNDVFTSWIIRSVY